MFTKVKICLGDDIRVCKCEYKDEADAIFQITEFVEKSFGIKKFSIKYMDEEGDEITMTTSGDFTDAIQAAVSSKKMLKLFIYESKSAKSFKPVLDKLERKQMKQEMKAKKRLDKEMLKDGKVRKHRIELVENALPSAQGASIEENSQLVKTWRLRNVDERPLPPGLELVYQGKRSSPIVEKLVFEVGNGEPILSGEEFTVHAIVNAPSVFGKFKSTWRLRSEGKSIGPKLPFVVDFASSNEVAAKRGGKVCVCGGALKRMQVEEIYDAPQKTSKVTVYCDLCERAVKGGVVFHCPVKYAKEHVEGYDVCPQCYYNEFSSEEGVSSDEKKKKKKTTKKKKKKKMVGEEEEGKGGSEDMEIDEEVKEEEEKVYPRLVKKKVEKVKTEKNKVVYCYAEQLKQLKEVFVTDDDAFLKRMLAKYSGNVQQTIHAILN